MTVRELRDKIVDMAQGVSFSEITAFLGLLDSYADAAREDGVQSVLDDPSAYDLFSRQERD
jgi:hypothetical protein